MTVTKIPPRSPNCNPHAERFIRSVREECTNRVLISDRGHAEKIRQEYACHFNTHPPSPQPTSTPRRPERHTAADSSDRTPTNRGRTHQQVPPSSLTTRRNPNSQPANPI
ncbi:integrase core domain-containing protein [Saccharopolyspora sp. NPDC050389]|uniref:integrase core domain-containing protein n=1 Tax=Saccharopolyspora sp. NPDC050389 TaxID=3155516 RepID=UPI0033DA7B4D